MPLCISTSWSCLTRCSDVLDHSVPILAEVYAGLNKDGTSDFMGLCKITRDDIDKSKGAEVLYKPLKILIIARYGFLSETALWTISER